MKRVLSLIFAVLFLPLNMYASISPNEMGFRNAKTDIERYWVLYKTHERAIKSNQDVTYLGISDFTIEIPENAVSIPLPARTNFGGVTITVINNNKDNFFLFTLKKEFERILIPQEIIDKGTFTSVKKLSKGTKLLVIADRMAWVQNRKGYDYGANRRDILLLNNGVADNTPVMPYGNIGISTPECYYTDADDEVKEISNLHLIRSPKSTRITRLLRVEGLNNVRIENISLSTPRIGRLYGDGAISIADCVNVIFSNVIIDGTYSHKDKYGYGIVLNNVWNSTFNKLKGNANWGVFGNWNVNVCTLNECDINRFDVHCYGKDILFKNCVLRDNYSQFSSVYGFVRYDDCSFIDYVPYLNEPSYNAYTPVTFIMNNCKMYIDNSNNEGIICRMCNSLDEENNPRPELSKKTWPDVYINGLELSSRKPLIGAYLFYVRNHSRQNTLIDGCRYVVIRNLRYNGNFKLSNRQVKLKEDMYYFVELNEGISPLRGTSSVIK